MIALAGGLALAGVVSDAGPPPASSGAPRRVALLVGIDRYIDPALGDLRFAAKDAIDLAEVLADPRAGNFNEIQVLSGEVTEADFWDAFEGATAYLRRDDTFVLFIAGHGTLTLTGSTELYVMPTDGSLGKVQETGISVALLQEEMKALASRRRALVLDTCHTGTGRSVLPPREQELMTQLRGPLPAPMALAVSQSEVRMYASYFNQPSLEDAELENGVFTHFLIEALRGRGDQNGDGLVEAIEAHAWARDATLQHTGGVQVPWIESRLVGREAVYLAGDPAARSDAERALLLGLAKLPYNATIQVNGAQRRGAGVDPGRHRLTVAIDGEVLLDQRVRLSAGDELMLDELVAARARRWFLDGGAEWTAPNDWTATAGPQVGMWWAPPDPGGGRLVLGGEATMGIGDLPSGQLLARAGWWWGDRLSVGPTVSAGLFWRLRNEAWMASEEWQGAPVVAPGTVLRQTAGPLQLSLHTSALVFSAEEQLLILPRVGASVGWAL